MHFLLSLLLLSSSNSFVEQGGASDWVEGKTGQAQLRLVSPLESLGPQTQELTLAAQFKLEPDWHVYWKNPGDIGYGPRVSWQLPEGWEVDGEMLFQFPKRFAGPENIDFDAASFGYEDNAWYFFRLKGPPLPSGIADFESRWDYLVCESVCIQERSELHLPLAVSEERPSSFAQQIDNELEKVPQSNSNIQAEWKNKRQFELSFHEPVEELFLYSPQSSGEFWTTDVSSDQRRWQIELKEEVDEVEWIARQENEASLSGQSQAPKPNTPLALLSILFFAFLGGAILNLMPCVLPVLMLKTSSLLKLAQQRARVRESVGLTILGIFFSFAVLAGFIAGLQFFGFQVGWGFQFQSPGFVSFMLLVIFVFALNLFGLFEVQLPASVGSNLAQKHGSFLEGVFATILATPCSAPFLGVAIAFAFSQPPAWLFLIFLVMALGFASPYIAFLISPQIVDFLPKPGPWMERMKRILGYSLLIAALWLFYILGRQTELMFLFATLSVLLVVFLLIREFRNSLKWSAVVLIFIALPFFAESLERQKTARESDHIEFSEQELETLISEGETVFLNITADWCLTCKYNEYRILNTDWFQQKVEEQDILYMLADWTQRDESIGRFLEKHGRAGIPFSMIRSPEQEHLLPELLTRSNVEKALEKFKKSEAKP